MSWGMNVEDLFGRLFLGKWVYKYLIYVVLNRNDGLIYIRK